MPYHAQVNGTLLSHRQAIAADERMYVANRSLENVTRGVRVTMCDIDSEYYGTFGAYGVSAGQFIWPSTCTLDSRGRVYVSDEQLHRISVFDGEGALLSTWDEHGAGEGQMDTPSCLAFDSDDNLYVADTYNHRVQKFTTEGRFPAFFGREGTGPAELNLPWGPAKRLPNPFKEARTPGSRQGIPASPTRRLSRWRMWPGGGWRCWRRHCHPPPGNARLSTVPPAGA